MIVEIAGMKVSLTAPDQLPNILKEKLAEIEGRFKKTEKEYKTLQRQRRELNKALGSRLSHKKTVAVVAATP